MPITSIWHLFTNLASRCRHPHCKLKLIWNVQKNTEFESKEELQLTTQLKLSWKHIWHFSITSKHGPVKSCSFAWSSFLTNSQPVIYNAENTWGWMSILCIPAFAILRKMLITLHICWLSLCTLRLSYADLYTVEWKSSFKLAGHQVHFFYSWQTDTECPVHCYVFQGLGRDCM